MPRDNPPDAAQRPEDERPSAPDGTRALLQFTGLRLFGFKSFVDATELVIERGLTGIVGPNGCGKSNLIEALRWVMGEASARQLRGGEMDDVIFAGTSTRPARDVCEVAVALDNSAGAAPHPFDAPASIEISRRIDRARGSTYRINGKEVRTRDVQLLLADSATGARSTALISQGQIGSLIAAKPRERRVLLEEAAGITGLYSRRHEAELRLRAAEANLERLEDVLATLEAQLVNLNKQARQAARYRALSERIRTAEVELLAQRWRSARQEVTAKDRRLTEARREVEETGRAAETAAIRRKETAGGLPELRQREADALATLQSLTQARDGLDTEERRVEADRKTAHQRLDQAVADLNRERALIDDADAALARFEGDSRRVEAAGRNEPERRAAAAAALEEATREVDDLDGTVSALTADVAAVEAARTALARSHADLVAQTKRLDKRAADLAAQKETLAHEQTSLPDVEALSQAAKTAAEAVETARRKAAAAEQHQARAAAEASAAAQARQTAATDEARLRAEQEALADVLGPDRATGQPSLLDGVTAEPGLELAIAAALGDDLLSPVWDPEGHAESDAGDGERTAPGTAGGDGNGGDGNGGHGDGGHASGRHANGGNATGSHANGGGRPVAGERRGNGNGSPAVDRSARSATYWRSLPPLVEPAALPAGVEALGGLVGAPDALARRLCQVGVVASPGDGSRLQPMLAPGQRLVTRDGGQWRWDGFTTVTGTSPAAARLRQRNRLKEVRERHGAAQEALRAASGRAESTRRAADDAETARREARTAVRSAEAALAGAERAEQDARTRTSRFAAREAALLEAEGPVLEECASREAAERACAAELAALEDPSDARARLDRLRRELTARRASQAERRAEVDELAREAERRRRRLEALARDQVTWRNRRDAAREQLSVLEERRRQAAEDLERLSALPAVLAEKRRRLLAELEAATAARRDRAERLAAAETTAQAAEDDQRRADAAAVAAREQRVRAEAEAEQAHAHLKALSDQVRDGLGMMPEDLDRLEASDPAAALDAATMTETEGRLARMRRERDMMGPVNLRAEHEATELRARIDSMGGEKDDLVAAIAKLRHGIAELNREGRERLMASFADVDRHFRLLFERLFGGGRAHLALTESDNVLEAGLEIMASPPGKRLQSLSLMSGGEQALATLALVFAVFSSTPAPICVLDEVDAPLDDANVDRLCGLLTDVTRSTGTRFLVVTHHRMTMARMDRLFGVTMSERGVSQLVSVDLGAAEALSEAERVA